MYPVCKPQHSTLHNLRYKPQKRAWVHTVPCTVTLIPACMFEMCTTQQEADTPTESRAAAAAAAARWLWAEERQFVLSPWRWILLQQLLSSLHKLLRNTADMVLHSKEFSTAGKTAGLQIWRIENMEMVAVPESLHGNFYTGDAYVILYTVKQRDNSFYHLHFWLGKRTCPQLLTGVVLQRHQCPLVSIFSP